MKTLCRLALVVLAFTALNIYAATLYVSLDSTNPIPPFASWETAATNIQNAVDAAKAADTVLVTNGVYATGDSVGNRVAITNSIRLESVSGPLATIIDGGWDGDRRFGSGIGVRCVYLGNNSVLSGFTLTNGHAESGGGVLCEPSGMVTNCVLTGNLAYVGGGASGGTLYNCTLSGNSASGKGVGDGGGASGSTLYNCTLSGNSASAFGAGGGGAMSCTLYNCTLSGNSTGGKSAEGGGASGSTLYNCTLSGNSASGDFAAWGGGASGGTLYNCTLTDNYSAEAGGGAHWSTLYNCTLTDNSSLYGGGAYGGTLYNCVVYYNTAENGANYLTGIGAWGDEISTLLKHCCTTPLPTNGVGNISGPPLFMDMAAGDFRLREGSPCIDAGTNLVGLVITDPNTGELLTYAHDPTDILGNTRFIDGNGDGKVAWDIGAYEFNSFKPPRFSVFPQLTPDGWQLSVTGAPNKWARLQRSANLKDWGGIPFEIPVFMGEGGIGQFNDGDTGQKAMFYRVVVP